jgi:predicted CXXCH cytochrome family protein
MIFLISASCSTERGYEVLSFFFDGVPEDIFLDKGEQVDSLISTDTNRIVQEDLIVSQIKRYIHEPYRERQCELYHNQSRGQVLEDKKLCFNCHESYELSRLNVHVPVSEGECSSCHQAHQSEFPYLLKQEGAEICGVCHDAVQTENNPVHAFIDYSNCMKCHDPHGEENTFLLKRGSCFECHDDFRATFSYLHGPVAGGFCSTCHETHTSESDYKLILQGQDLCFKCHTKDDIALIDSHETGIDFNCLDCHHPHGGEDRFILR